LYTAGAESKEKRCKKRESVFVKEAEGNAATAALKIPWPPSLP
jgi:hypothetical protein